MKTTENTAGQSINKARLNPGRQWVGIRNLEFIEEVQPRAGLDRGWVNDLSKFRLEGSEFPPIKVFQTPEGRLIPGEGHHRSMAMSSAGEDQILCDVVDGTMEDAIVFAAGSNRSNGVKPMGPKDVTKAVEMLLAIDKWWNSTIQSIAKHIGCSTGKVITIRNRISARDGRPLPDVTIDPKTQQKWFRASKGDSRKIHSQWGGKSYAAVYRGERIQGRTEDEVRTKLDEVVSARKRRTFLAIRSQVSQMGFTGIFRHTGRTFPGLAGFRAPGAVCAPCDFEEATSLPLAVGQLIACRRQADPGARMIVVCYPEDGPQKVIDLYRAEGFEFLTPEELAESLKAPGDDSSSPSPSPSPST